MKINKIIKLSDAFATEVNVLRDYSYRSPEGNEEKVKGYLPNKSSRDILKSILLSCSESTDKKLHLIISSYGTGKSYLLLILANLLANKKVESSFVDKIKDKENYYNDGLSKNLDNHLNNSKPFLIVIPEYGDNDFDHALLEGLKFALKNNDIDYVPKTNYEEAIKTIKHWNEKSTHNYKQLKENITGTTIEKFIEQLQSYDKTTYVEFKKIYKEIIGNTFSDSHTSAYPIFADTAKEIRKLGFRGIAIIYDEFGEMLSKLINSSSSSTGLSIQQFIEDLKEKKDGTNILFISASHQDPQSLRTSKEKDLNKIIGRFERHQLLVSEAEGEEIIGTIFIKENPKEFEKIYKNPLFHEHLQTIEDFNLYPDKETSWIEAKVLENLYPLHPLTSYILPRLSAEFAQNTRSMFNFLSPTETKDGAFRIYLESKNVFDDGNLNLFTPDLLLDFFLKNIREDKGSMVQAYYEAYREGLGKINDENQISIMKNLFMLYVVNKSLIQPNKETLFWAMNWQDSRRQEFHNLLDDMVTTWEFLELNPTNNNYQFPDFGAAPLSKVIDEEVKKLDELSLSQCMVLWNEIFKIEDLPLRDHNNRFGCNRTLCTESVNDIGDLIRSLKELEDYYHNKHQYFGNGYVFYLLGTSEDELEEIKNTFNKYPMLLEYIVFATPINLPQFDSLIKETLFYKAIQNTSKRPDVLQNPARLKSIEDQNKVVFSKLEEKIKTLYEPSNWNWNYLQEKDIELSSKIKFSNWINHKTDHLFSETPVIKDDALWFLEGNKGAKDRKQALDILLNSDKDRIPLRDDNNNAADKRIIRNFFANTSITTDKKREKNIQYGEIKMPDQDSQFFKAWKLIESKLKTGSYVNVNDIINPLLQAPYGLSENIIKFLLTAYIRYEIERVTISDSKRKSVLVISVDLLDLLISRPSEYLIRKIEITGPELRYLNHLKKLFDKQDVNTWMDVTNKFIGISQFLTPLQKSIIKNSGINDLQKFYSSLEDLKAEFQINGSDKEKISKEYFQENLPSLLYNEGRTLIEDDTKVTGLVSKLDFFKKYPSDNEAELKIEVIRELSNEVFGVSIVTKSEITKVVANWFKKLPAPNQSGKFGNPIITKWLSEIKNSFINDPFELYLVELNEKPIKDWNDISYEKFSFINRFKDYKKTVEDYTKSPIEVIQIIARSMFEKTAAECSSELAFESFIIDWWNALPNIKKVEQYSPQTNVFITQISIPSSIKTRYLEIIPQSWEKFKFLPAYIPSNWESWSNSDATIVGDKYLECIQEIINWKPPVEVKQLLISLDNIFDVQDSETFDQLYNVAKEWYDELPSRTKNANWELINEDISILMTALNNKNTFEKFITVDLPFVFKLPEFKNWNDTVLERFTEKFNSLKNSVEIYKRPLFELIEIIENKEVEKSSSEEGFCFTLSSQIKESEVYKNKINSELLTDPFSKIIYKIAQENGSKLSLSNIIQLISIELSINSDWNLWSDKEDKSFVTAFKKGIEHLIKWKFPEAEKLKTAKSKVKEEILLLQNELDLNESQMRKVLNDIIEDK
jgi:hypothetical protein